MHAVDSHKTSVMLGCSMRGDILTVPQAITFMRNWGTDLHISEAAASSAQGLNT